MSPFRIFQIAYFLSLVVVVLVGLVDPLYPGWPGVGFVWAMIVFGLALYVRAYSLTVKAAKVGGADVEQNRAPRELLASGRFSRALIIVFAVQAFVGIVATWFYLADGLFFTMFLGLEIVALLFGIWDWLNDEMEMRRYLSTHSTHRGAP